MRPGRGQPTKVTKQKQPGPSLDCIDSNKQQGGLGWDEEISGSRETHWEAIAIVRARDDSHVFRELQ